MSSAPLSSHLQTVWLAYLQWTSIATTSLSDEDKVSLWRFVAEHAARRLSDLEWERKFKRGEVRA